MPEIKVGAQIFDVVFHPAIATVYTGLLTGHVKGYAYDNQGNHKIVFNARPFKSSCRGLSLNEDGSRLYAVGKGKTLSVLDTATETVDKRARAHETSINRVQHLMPWLLATGDDDGVVKLWDPRQRAPIQEYTHHFDYITDFLWLNDKKQLVATSGDGTLSVVDVRSKTSKPIAQSEDQEDELLSIVPIKGGAKMAVGTQLGVISIFNRKRGWGDCVDRIPGHPFSVDTMCSLPDDFPRAGDNQSTIITGSSDGYVRAMEILPSKLLGVVVDHGEWPIERISLGRRTRHLTVDQEPDSSSDQIKSLEETQSGETVQPFGTWWIGSVGHDEVLHLTDLEVFFHQHETKLSSNHDSDGEDSEIAPPEEDFRAANHRLSASLEDHGHDSDELNMPAPVTKRSRTEKDGSPPPQKKKRIKRKVIEIEGAFFDGL